MTFSDNIIDIIMTEIDNAKYIETIRYLEIAFRDSRRVYITRADLEQGTIEISASKNDTLIKIVDKAYEKTERIFFARVKDIKYFTIVEDKK